MGGRKLKTAGHIAPVPLRVGQCHRVRIEGTCADCSDVVAEVHVDTELKIRCAACCPNCARQRRRTGDQ